VAVANITETQSHFFNVAALSVKLGLRFHYHESVRSNAQPD